MEKKVRLEGVTLHGKNKVREHGEIWNVLEIRNAECLGGALGYLLESIGKTRDKRWVKTTGDSDFRVFNERSSGGTNG